MDEQQVQEFLDFLTEGKAPEGFSFRALPGLSIPQATSVLYYLQEHAGLIPDRFEVCDCGTVVDSHRGGHTVSDEDAEEYSVPHAIGKNLGLSDAEVKEAVTEHLGMFFCGETCEINFWTARLED